MKYLVNIVFVSLFIVTVGCSNELIGLDEEITPISNTEMTVSADNYQEVAFDSDGTTSLDNGTFNKEQPKKTVGSDVSLTSGGGDEPDTPVPPGGGN